MADPSPLLGAVRSAARRLASTGHFDHILRDVLVTCVDAVGAWGGTVYLHDPSRRELVLRHVLPEEVASRLPIRAIADDFGVAGQVFQTRRSVISQFETDDPQRKPINDSFGTVITSMITVPLNMEDEEPIGVVQLHNKIGGPFNANDAAVLDTVSAVSTMAYLNSKLLDESTRASQLLGMGKVGHDIKNMAFALEANVSFSDETLGTLRDELREQAEIEIALNLVEDLGLMFHDLRESIERIKRYATLMSDLSAGKTLEPQMRLMPMGVTIERAAAFLASEARSRSVELLYDVEMDAPPTMHDEMYLLRIVQNLVSNGVKAVSERADHRNGTVIVRYRFQDHAHVLEVIDEGPGMTREIAERILNGTVRSNWMQSSGSGWGTKIILELAATHAAKVTIDSVEGVGSTFRVTFPEVTT